MSDRRVATLLGVGTVLVFAALLWPHYGSYAVRGDAAALVLHSARFYGPSASEWFTRGFTDYFVSYPEVSFHTAYVRPVVNLSFWLESLFASGPDSPLFFATNLLGHAVVVALVFLVGRRTLSLDLPRALAAAALFAFTATAHELLVAPAFRADMLAALLSLTAWLLADRDTHSGRRIAAIAVLLALALATKETAIVMPLAVGAMLWRRGRQRDAAVVMAVPLFLFAALRLLAPNEGLNVSVQHLGLRAVHLSSGVFLPLRSGVELLATWRAPHHARALAAAMSGLALNLLGLAWVALRVRRDGRIVASFLAIALAAMILPIVLAPFVRLLYLSQAFALLALVASVPRLATGRASRALVPIAALSFVVLGPLTLARVLWRDRTVERARNGDAAALRASARRLLADSTTRRLYLLNDRVGEQGTQAMLAIAAHEAGREGVTLRVIDALQSETGNPQGTLDVGSSVDSLRIAMRCTSDCSIAFPGTPAGSTTRLGAPGIITYRGTSATDMVALIPRFSAGDAAVFGWDPHDPGLHQLARRDPAWQRVPFTLPAAR
ncbi:MAG: hypothetical protein JWO05_2073 [Gemmatimonadetes bacterium]|nr:hypothetical protein [Gemmatimonadota bacterium]